MSVDFDVHYTTTSGSQEVDYKHDAPCFGMLCEYNDMDNVVRTNKVVFHARRWSATRDWKVWARFLESLPFIQDSLSEPIVYERSNDNQEVHVRCDIPADRMLNVLSLFRVPYTHRQAIRAFVVMTDADVEPKVAATIALGVIGHRIDGIAFCDSYDPEHSIVNRMEVGMLDAISLHNVLFGSDWASVYNGEQELYSESLTYRRGEQGDDNYIMGWTQPHGGVDSSADSMCHTMIREQFPELWDRVRRGTGSLRGSERQMDINMLVKAAEWFENKLKEA
jgi:hypothetical protein